MTKIFSKTNLGIFLVLIILFSILIFSNSFTHVRNGLTDKLYDEKKPLSNLVIVKIDDESINKIGRWPWDRSVFASLLEKTKNAKVVGIDVSFFEKSNNDSSLVQQLSKMDNVVLASEVAESVIYGPIFNSSTGYVNLFTDYDGITREVNFGLSKEIRPFAFEIYKKAWSNNAIFNKEIKIINFADFRDNSISVYDALTKDFDFKGKIVLIGATAPNLHDNYFVPTSKGIAMSGVEIHASILQNLIVGDFLKSESNLLVFALVLFFGFSGMFILSRLRLIYTVIITIAILASYAFVANFAYSNLNLILDLFFTPLSLIIYTGAGIGANYWEEKRRSKFISDAFGKYISKELLDEIINKRHELKLGGTKREITILFSDIRGFTEIGEKLSPEELVHFINEYLTDMTKIIMKHKGTVDKFLGDAIMAFWNAPLIEKEHAKLACESIIEQSKALIKLKEKFAEKKLPEIKVGCGINTGEAIIGNMGSEERFDYTAIGDNVNLASRLEGLTKQYDVGIIASESTYNLVKNSFNFRKLDKVRVKGKKIPITIYELCVEYDEKFTKQFEKALELYFNRKFTEARKEFEKAREIKKDDLPSRLFMDRCSEHIKNPPGSDWDGSYEIKSK